MKETDKSPHNQIVNHFFVLKGWDYQSKEFYRSNNIIYGRHVKPAKELLILCDESVEMAKEKLDKIAKWADKNCFDKWLIETVIKKWLEIDKL